MRQFTGRRLLFIVITIAFLIRIINPAFGSPALYTVPDEVPNYLAAWEMLANKTLITSSQYPPLGSYILLPFNILAYLFFRLTRQIVNIPEFELFLLTHEGYFLFIPRLISAVFGTLSLVIVHKLARLLFPGKSAVALWAVLLTAFSLTHLQLSHLGKPWMPSHFFYLLGIYWVIKKNLLPAAFSLGIALGFHFSALYAFLFIFVIRLKFMKKAFLFPSIKSWLIVGGIPLTSLIIYKKLLMTYAYHSTEFADVLLANIRGGLLNGVWFYVKELLLTEPLLSILLVISLFHYRSWPKAFRPIMTYSLVYFLIIALTFYQSLRYLLPILPLLSFPAAYTLNKIWTHLVPRVYRPGASFGLSLLIIFPSFLWLLRWNEAPTFINAQNWLNQNVSRGIPIASTAVRFSAFVPTPEAIHLMQKVKPGVWGKLEKYETVNAFPETARNIIYLDVVTTDITNSGSIKEFMQRNHINLLIQSYWDPSGRLIAVAPNDWKLVQNFSPHGNSQFMPLTNLIHGSTNIVKMLLVERLGPYIDIVEVNEEM